MAVFLRDTPIKRKLMLVILLTNGFVLLLMGSALITFELVTFRRSLATNLGVLADITGANSTGAIAFQDPRSAQGILAALSAEEQITKAAIYDRDGTIFARFPASLSFENFPQHPRADGYRFDRANLALFHPILQEGTRLGTIYLQADLGEMYCTFRGLRPPPFVRGGCLFVRRDRSYDDVTTAHLRSDPRARPRGRFGLRPSGLLSSRGETW